MRAPYELRRIDWGPQDDAVVDAMLVGGKGAEAQAYFEERKATSVPVYRQTLRYHWTQTGEKGGGCRGCRRGSINVVVLSVARPSFFSPPPNIRRQPNKPDTEINVGVPVPRPVKGSSMHLIVAEDALQMALIDDQSFGVVSGKFAGQIDPSTSGWRLGAFGDVTD